MLIFARRYALHLNIYGSAVSQQMRDINKTRTSYLSRERRHRRNIMPRAICIRLRRPHPRFFRGGARGISRVNRRPFSTTRGAPMADIIDSFIRACGKQMADAIQTQSSPWPLKWLPPPLLEDRNCRGY